LGFVVFCRSLLSGKRNPPPLSLTHVEIPLPSILVPFKGPLLSVRQMPAPSVFPSPQPYFCPFYRAFFFEFKTLVTQIPSCFLSPRDPSSTCVVFMMLISCPSSRRGPPVIFSSEGSFSCSHLREPQWQAPVNVPLFRLGLWPPCAPVRWLLPLSLPRFCTQSCASKQFLSVKPS